MKRQPLEIKKEIFRILAKESPLSVKQLEIRIQTSYVSILNNCKELEYLGFVRFKTLQEGIRNGRECLMVELIKLPRDI